MRNNDTDRAAVLVESVVVILFLIILFFGAVEVSTLYRRHQLALASSLQLGNEVFRSCWQGSHGTTQAAKDATQKCFDDKLKFGSQRLSWMETAILPARSKLVVKLFNCEDSSPVLYAEYETPDAAGFPVNVSHTPDMNDQTPGSPAALCKMDGRKRIIFSEVYIPYSPLTQGLANITGAALGKDSNNWQGIYAISIF